MSRPPYFTAIRLGSAVAVFALKLWLPRPLYLSIFYAILFGHYFLQFVYSRRQMKTIAGSSLRLAAIAVLAVLCAIFIVTRQPSLILYFGLHAALNEAYMVATASPSAFAPARARSLLLARFAFNFFTYCFILLPFIPEVSPVVIWVGFGATGIAFFLIATRALDTFTWSVWLDMMAFEWLGFIIAMVAHGHVEFQDMLFYHIIEWTVWPLGKLVPAGRAARYLMETVGVSAFFFLGTPVIGLLPGATAEIWQAQSIIWGYIHVTVSYALSSFNPAFITRWFAARARVANPQ